MDLATRPTPTRRPASSGAGPTTVPRRCAVRDGRRTQGRQLFEITTFREEVYAEEHRKPAVTFAKDIETDLSRRDFTINAMAVRLPGGEFLDPFGGVKHLAAKILDTPLEPEVAFSDDPLRMLRAARFVSQLDVTPAERVVRAITEMRDRLSIVSAERIHAELDRLLLGARPSAGLALIVETGLSDLFLPELSALQLEQDPVHQHKDVLRHTYAVVERCEPDLVLRLAALLHDIGKPKTRSISPDGVQFHHHEVVGARMAEARMKELHYSNVDGRGRPQAGRAPPPLPRVRRRLDRQRGAPLRARRRAVARSPEPADPGRLHDPERCPCAQARTAAGRARGADRPPGRGGEPERAAAAHRRGQVMKHLGDPAGPRGRRGARLPVRAADGAWPDPRGRGVRAAGCVGAGA